MIKQTTEVFKLSLDGIFDISDSRISSRNLNMLKIKYHCYHCNQVHNKIVTINSPRVAQSVVKYVHEKEGTNVNPSIHLDKIDFDFKTNILSDDEVLENIVCKNCNTELKKILLATACGLSPNPVIHTARKVEYESGKVSYIINYITPRVVYSTGRLFLEKTTSIVSKLPNGRIYIIPKKIGDFRIVQGELNRIFSIFRNTFEDDFDLKVSDYLLNMNSAIRDLFKFADLQYGDLTLSDAITTFKDNLITHHPTLSKEFRRFDNGYSHRIEYDKFKKNCFRKIYRDINNGKIKEFLKFGLSINLNKDLKKQMIYFVGSIPFVIKLLEMGYKDQEISNFIKDIISSQEMEFNKDFTYSELSRLVNHSLEDVHVLKSLENVTFSNSKAMTTVKRIYAGNKKMYKSWNSEIQDTLRMIRYLMDRVETYRFPRNMTPETHDIVMKSYNDLRALEALERQNREAQKELHVLNDMDFEIECNENYYIHEPKHGKDLIMCGIEMSICVGSYVNSISEGRHVYMVREKGTDKYIACLEVNGSKREIEKQDDVSEVFENEVKYASDLRLNQSKLVRNARVGTDKEIYKVVSEFCTKNKIDFSDCYDMVTTDQEVVV